MLQGVCVGVIIMQETNVTRCSLRESCLAAPPSSYSVLHVHRLSTAAQHLGPSASIAASTAHRGQVPPPRSNDDQSLTMWDGSEFSGTKIALLCGEAAVAYLRDDTPDIPFPGMWDLPGGGREGGEGPVACGLREVEEEFGLSLCADDVVVIERHRSTTGGLDSYFCAMTITREDVARIRFGTEGQYWQMMPVRDFVRHERAVPHLRNRLKALVDLGLV